MKKCDLCGIECKEDIVIRDACVIQPIQACLECLNDYANQDFDKLTKKLEKLKQNEKT